MAFYKQKHHLLQTLPVLLLLFPFSSIHFSHASGLLHQSSFSGGWKDGTFPWSTIIDDYTPHSTYNPSVENTSFILAAERTKRKDPTNFYNYYRGGWNISDEHYWTSAAFSAVPIFSIAIAWFMGFGIVLLFICCCSCFCRGRRDYYSRSGFIVSLIMLIVFTCTSITGCIIVYINQGMFHNSSISMLDYVKDQSNFVATNLQNFSSNMAAAKNISVHQVFLPADLLSKVGDTVRKITISADELSSRMAMNFGSNENFLKTVRIDLIIDSTAMLVLVFLGLLFSIRGLQFLVYCLVLVGWILITATFILCGVLVLLHIVVGDTCVAMDEWILRPQAGTALDDILPCVDAAIITESLLLSKDLAIDLANVVNNVIVNVSNAKFHSSDTPLNFNQSGPLMPMLCIPYEPDLGERKCLPNEVSFDDALQVWKGFICNTKVISGKEICSTVGRTTPTMYSQMAAATGMSKSLYHCNLFLVRMTNCSSAREAFSFIDSEYCPGLELYSKGMYSGLTVFSASVMLSLILWMVHVRERRRQKFSELFVTYGGRPPSVEENKIVAEISNDQF